LVDGLFIIDFGFFLRKRKIDRSRAFVSGYSLATFAYPALLAFTLGSFIVMFDVGPECVERAQDDRACFDLFTHESSAGQAEGFDHTTRARFAFKGITDGALIQRRCGLNELLLAFG